MVAKVNKMADWKGLFKEQLLLIHEKEAKIVAKEVSDRLEHLLTQTINDKDASNEKGFRDAKPVVEVKMKLLKTKGVEITFTSYMSVNGTKTRHKIWHILNKGRAAYVAKKDVLFKTRNPSSFGTSARTSPNNFNTSPFAGYTGEYAKINKGTLVKEIPPRRWYRILRTDTRLQFQRGRLRKWKLGKIEVSDG